jgi:hypothetical protein
MIYLASPYTGHADSIFPPRALQEFRYQAAKATTALLISRGYRVFSPIVHGHELDTYMEANGFPRPGWEWWMGWSEELLRAADEVWVLCLHGWDESAGVRQEIAIAKLDEIPLRFVNMQGEFLEEEL